MKLKSVLVIAGVFAVLAGVAYAQGDNIAAKRAFCWDFWSHIADGDDQADEGRRSP